MIKRVPGSFRDPSGFVFENNGNIFRAISPSYKNNFGKFIDSGLYDHLCDKGLIIRFNETPSGIGGIWKTIQLERIPFISYPYEWSFSQLKNAALTTLDIQLIALEHGMSLKDSSAYNIQFFRGNPIFIDHLSFEKLEEGKPWSAYRQFVMHFLGPLALMSKADVRHGLQLRNFIDGLPLDYISNTLPKTTWLNPNLLMHIHLHAALQKKYSDTNATDIKKAREKIKATSLSLNSLKNLIHSLKAATASLRLPSLNTEWANYYEDTNYTQVAFNFKKDAVNRIAERFSPKVACDLGANDGEFSRILSKYAGFVISADIDPLAVNKNYERSRFRAESSIIPVLQDLCNPSPSLGWSNNERSSFIERARCDFVMGLALIHHLCIGNNIPMAYVAGLFRSLAQVALVEFVPKEDSQVIRLLSARRDIFVDYTLENCTKAFKEHYGKVENIEIPESSRTLLLFYE